MFNLFGIFVLVVATGASALGTIALKHAALSANPALAILGASLWGSSAAGFVWLSRTADLGVLSIVTSAFGILLVQAAALLIFGESITQAKLVALALLILAMVLLNEPPSGT
ncbi:hypothetical protein [Gymnodinialimonas sp.]